MKKFLVLFAIAIGLVACNPESLEENGLQQTEKNKVCPPGQPNC
jgi:hypothetical protein